VASLPAWAESLRQRYLSGEAAVFLLHGNVRDLQPWTEDDGATAWLTLGEFLARFLTRTKALVVEWSVSEPLSVAEPARAVTSGAVALSGEDRLRRAVNARRLLARKPELGTLPTRAREVLALAEELLTDPAGSNAVVLDTLEALAPAAEWAFLSEDDKANLATLLRLGGDPAVLGADNLLVLVTESLPDVNRRLAQSAHVAAVHVPFPDETVRARFLTSLDLRGVGTALTSEQLARVTAGLTLAQVRGLVRQVRQSGGTLDFHTVNARKKQLVEQACGGLVELVTPSHGFAQVGGMEGIKTELSRIAGDIRDGHHRRVPMGLLFVGAMGTGKTFLAEAFARESGLTCLKLKGFRERWVGATEANLERILQLVEALGYALLILDEADRSLGGTPGESDGGTSSRVIARLKEFMSDTRHRGRVLTVLMTNRPDKLDTDLKRPGRLDVKVPLFYPESAEERRAIGEAVLRRAGGVLAEGVTLHGMAAATEGRSAAELEALLIAAVNFAAWEGRSAVTGEDLARAVMDTVPSRDARMIAYMELLAVFECSARRMLPPRFAELSTEEVQARLDVLRAQLGARVA
jgi:AAA+ superfamily predicted ATPase